MEDECSACGCTGPYCHGCHGSDPIEEPYTDEQIDDIERLYEVIRK